MRASSRNCEACGGAEVEPLLERNGYPVVACAACGLVYVDARLSDADIARLYGRGYYEGDIFDRYMAEDEPRLALARHRVRRLRRRQPGGALLEVGSAAGYFLEAASAVYDVTGVEVSAYAAQHARERFGHGVITGELPAVRLPAATFDVVAMWDTVEHLREPAATLREIGRVTRPGGVVVMSTGDVESRLARRDLGRWPLMTPPWHLFFFSVPTLGRLLSAAGFRIERVERDGVVSTRPRLNTLPVVAVASALRQGSTMTVYARRDGAALSG